GDGVVERRDAAGCENRLVFAEHRPGGQALDRHVVGEEELRALRRSVDELAHAFTLLNFDKTLVADDAVDDIAGDAF
ncbi:hypothetical protein CGJ34_25020, partial [Vibrio parahaemolyticus]